MSRCVVILGMHRSGTSCLARILHQAGLDLGNGLQKSSVPDNLLGHWENLNAIRINDRILTASDGAWDRVPNKLVVDVTTTQEIVGFVNQWADVPIWGWKDPRTTLTFPAWQPHLPTTLIVACIRHPYAVARSLEVREGWSLERGLQLWLDYNRQLLKIAEDSSSEVCWYEHGVSRQQVTWQIQAACAASGLTYSDSLLEMINPHLDHQGTETEIADPELRDVYARLQGHARKHSPVSNHHPDGITQEFQERNSGSQNLAGETEFGSKELASDLKSLSEVVKASNVAIQQTLWMTRQLEECCRGLQNESAIGARALGDHIGQTREQTEMTQRQIAELQGIRNPASNAALSLREAITSLQEQQMHLAQEIAQCRASLEAFQNLLPFRIYRKLARNIKALWRAIRPHNSVVIAPLREGAVTSETPHPAVSPTDRRVA